MYLVVYMCTVCIQEPKEVRVGIGCSGIGVTDDWELLCCVLGIKLGSFGRTNIWEGGGSGREMGGRNF